MMDATNVQDEADETLLEDEPIKIRWTGKARRRIKGYNQDFDSVESDRFVRALSWQKTNIVIETVEEATAVASEMCKYSGAQRSWMNASMDRALARVQSEIVEEMGERGFDAMRSSGRVTGFEKQEPAAGGESERTIMSHHVVNVVLAGEEIVGVVRSTNDSAVTVSVRDSALDAIEYGEHDNGDTWMGKGEAHVTWDRVEFIESNRDSNIHPNDYRVDRHLEEIDYDEEELATDGGEDEDESGLDVDYPVYDEQIEPQYETGDVIEFDYRDELTIAVIKYNTGRAAGSDNEYKYSVELPSDTNVSWTTVKESSIEKIGEFDRDSDPKYWMCAQVDEWIGENDEKEPMTDGGRDVPEPGSSRIEYSNGELVMTYRSERSNELVVRQWRRVSPDEVRAVDVEKNQDWDTGEWYQDHHHVRTYDIDDNEKLIGDGSDWSGEGVYWVEHALDRHEVRLNKRFRTDCIEIDRDVVPVEDDPELVTDGGYETLGYCISCVTSVPTSAQHSAGYECAGCGGDFGAGDLRTHGWEYDSSRGVWVAKAVTDGGRERTYEIRATDGEDDVYVGEQSDLGDASLKAVGMQEQSETLMYYVKPMSQESKDDRDAELAVED